VAEVGADPGRLRIGVLDHPLLPGAAAHPECTEAVARAAELLQSLGHHVEEAWPVALEDPEFPRRYTTIVGACTTADLVNLERTLGRPVGEDDLEPDNLQLAEIGRSVGAADYVNAVAALHAWSRRVVGWWFGDDAFDLLLTPTLAGPPPPIGFLAGPHGGSRIRTLLQYTAQFNITGQPAVSLPLHLSADGLPVGIQLVAAPYREDRLVRVAAQLEVAAPWPLCPG
jgi:amidase